MTEPDPKREFTEQGYTIARRFFSEAEMAALIEDIRTARPREEGPDYLNKGEMLFYSNVFFRNPKLQAFVSQPRLVDFLKQVIGPDFWVRWDQAVTKRPGGVAFPWHQDNAYNRLKDEHYQLWVAMTPMNAENGHLWLIPGSHKLGLLPHKQVGNHLAYQGSAEKHVTIDAEAGDVVLFSSFMLHYTTPNISQRDRWAYVVEYVSLDHFDPFIQPPYFVVARHGRSDPRFVRYYRGRLRPANQMKYLIPRLRERAQSLETRVRRGLRGILVDRS